MDRNQPTLSRGHERGRCEQVAHRGDPRGRHATRPPPIPVKAVPQMTIALKHLAAALSDSHDLPKKPTRGCAGRSGDADDPANPAERSRLLVAAVLASGSPSAL